MIIVNDSDTLHEDFIKLLESTKIHTINELERINIQSKKLNGDEFETIVFNNCIKASKYTPFEGNIIQTGAHAFPDIIARKNFGIEVKMTTGDKWTSTGNSILETTRIDAVEKIYIFFGKFGKNIDICYRSYQECLYDIGVTHSPRYKIDMELPKGSSIFDKMEISYENFRNENNPIAKIKNYYRKQLKDGEELWWINNQTNETVNPIIKPLRMLSRNEQEAYLVEAMIFFPEIFGKSQTKYERPAAYLITKYNSISSSLRDTFTAGGKEMIILNNKQVIVPKVFYHLLSKAKDINSRIEDLDEEDLKYYWKTENVDTSRISQWKELLNTHAENQLEGIIASDIYSWGLK